MNGQNFLHKIEVKENCLKAERLSYLLKLYGVYVIDKPQLPLSIFFSKNVSSLLPPAPILVGEEYHSSNRSCDCFYIIRNKPDGCRENLRSFNYYKNEDLKSKLTYHCFERYHISDSNNMNILQ